MAERWNLLVNPVDEWRLYGETCRGSRDDRLAAVRSVEFNGVYGFFRRAPRIRAPEVRGRRAPEDSGGRFKFGKRRSTGHRIWGKETTTG